MQQHWFTKGNSNIKKGRTPIEENNKDKYIEHYLLIELICNKEKTENQLYIIQKTRVLAWFDKYHNKLYICAENSKVWYCSFPKGKYLVLYCMAEKDKWFGNHENVPVENSNEWNAY